MIDKKYRPIVRIIMWLDNEYGEGNDNVKLVKAALEKQIPKLPKEDGWLYCPVCGKDVCLEKPKYCSDCGQALDWSDTE